MRPLEGSGDEAKEGSGDETTEGSGDEATEGSGDEAYSYLRRELKLKIKNEVRAFMSA